MKKKSKITNDIKPTKIIPIGFMGVIFIGTLLLMLPISTRSGHLSFFDALFEATSATCVTGLIVVDTATTFTNFGQFVLLLLIQLGGLGFMAVATILFVILGKKISLKERMTMAESMGEDRLQGIIKLAVQMAKITFIVEGCGALLLMIRFIPDFGVMQGIWKSIFTSVSAFCNAGFDLMGNYQSLVNYAHDPLINITICLLIVIGGLGFGVIQDILIKKNHFKNYRLQTKVVLTVTLGLIFIPAIIFYLLEQDATMGMLTPGGKILASIFQSVTCRTAGFNTIDQLAMKNSSKLLSIGLMFIGGAPAGTAGGIKLTTISVMFFSIRSYLKGNQKAEAYERYISRSTIIKAFSIFFIAFTTLMTGVFIVSIVEGDHLGFINQLYELTSAIATVGLSVGVSGTASLLTRAIICLMMFTGRVGILTVAFAVGGKKEKPYIQYPEADIMVG